VQRGLQTLAGVVIVEFAMPIYEYDCASCSRISTHIIAGSERMAKKRCAHCGSTRTHRVMSSFAVMETESSRIARLDSKTAGGESFYRDPRNVGLWARKKAKEIGVDLGPKFDASVDKARSGKLIKEMF